MGGGAWLGGSQGMRAPGCARPLHMRFGKQLAVRGCHAGVWHEHWWLALLALRAMCLHTSPARLPQQVGTIEEACEMFPKADVLINFARCVFGRGQCS